MTSAHDSDRPKYRLALRYPDGFEIVTQETDEPPVCGARIDSSGVTWRVVGLQYSGAPPVVTGAICHPPAAA